MEQMPSLYCWGRLLLLLLVACCQRTVAQSRGDSGVDECTPNAFDEEDDALNRANIDVLIDGGDLTTFTAGAGGITTLRWEITTTDGTSFNEFLLRVATELSVETTTGELAPACRDTDGVAASVDHNNLANKTTVKGSIVVTGTGQVTIDASIGFTSPEDEMLLGYSYQQVVISIESTSTKAPTAPVKAPKAQTNAPKEATKAPKARTKAPKTPTKAPKAPTKAPKVPVMTPMPTDSPVADTPAPMDAPVTPAPTPVPETPSPVDTPATPSPVDTSAPTVTPVIETASPSPAPVDTLEPVGGDPNEVGECYGKGKKKGKGKGDGKGKDGGKGKGDGKGKGGKGKKGKKCKEPKSAKTPKAGGSEKKGKGGKGKGGSLR